MITAEQCRAARGWLDWSQVDLAKRASVGLSTVRDFEKGRHVPIATNLRAIEAALAAAGLHGVFSAAGDAVGISAAEHADGMCHQNQ